MFAERRRGRDAERSRTANPLRERTFRWFFIGRAVSVLGSSMSPVALAFAVLQTTGKPSDLGYVLAASMIPMVTLIIVGGGIADRFRRDAMLRVTNTLSGLAQAGMAACVFTARPVVFFVVLAFVNGTIQAFARPALNGIIPQIVDRASMQRANSILASTRNAASIIGPSVAGILVATAGGGWALALDALSFMLAAACMLLVNLPGKPKPAGGGLFHDLRLGWDYFRTTPWIWTGTAVFAVINAVQMGVWQVLGPVIAIHTIGAGQWGLVLSVRAAGLLLMSAIMTVHTVRGRSFVSAMIWLSTSAAPLVVLGLHADVAVLAVAAFLAGLGFSYSGVVWDTARHVHIPNEMLARASSYDDFGAFAAIPIGQLTVIPIASAIGTQPTALFGGILFLLVPLFPLMLTSVRNLGVERTPPTQPRIG